MKEISEIMSNGIPTELDISEPGRLINESCILQGLIDHPNWCKEN
jgi:hypothetical protein